MVATGRPVAGNIADAHTFRDTGLAEVCSGTAVLADGAYCAPASSPRIVGRTALPAHGLLEHASRRVPDVRSVRVGAGHDPIAAAFRIVPQRIRQGRSFSGFRTAQICLIRSPAISNANTVARLPSCCATKPGRPLTVHSRNVVRSPDTRAISA